MASQIIFKSPFRDIDRKRQTKLLTRKIDFFIVLYLVICNEYRFPRKKSVIMSFFKLIKIYLQITKRKAKRTKWSPFLSFINFTVFSLFFLGFSIYFMYVILVASMNHKYAQINTKYTVSIYMFLQWVHELLVFYKQIKMKTSENTNLTLFFKFVLFVAQKATIS